MSTLKRTYTIEAPLNEVFEALTTPELIKDWSGSDAIMDINKDGLFSLWGGSIHGINLYVTNKQIIQDWKEDIWDEYSRVTFNLSEKNGVTSIELIHELIPTRSFKAIAKGWDDYYMGPLKEMLES